MSLMGYCVSDVLYLILFFIQKQVSLYPTPNQICRSEGFARAAYFVPGRDGVGVGQDSRILPSASFARTRTNRSDTENRSDKIMLFLDQTPMWNWSTSEVSTTPSFRILRSPHQKFKKPGKADVVENREI